MKRSVLLLTSGIIGTLYLIYIIIYFRSSIASSDNASEAIGAGIATLIVIPHIICVSLAVIFNWIGWGLKVRWGALVAGIMYALSMVCMFIYAMFVLLEMIFCFVAFAKMKHIDSNIVQENIKNIENTKESQKLSTITTAPSKRTALFIIIGVIVLIVSICIVTIASNSNNKNRTALVQPTEEKNLVQPTEEKNDAVPSNPQSSAESDEAVLVVDQAELRMAFKNNQLSYKTKYKGKKLKITGNIKSITNTLAQTHVRFDTDDSFAVDHMDCMPSQKDELDFVELSIGQTITVIGIGDLGVVSPTLTQCKLVKDTATVPEAAAQNAETAPMPNAPAPAAANNQLSARENEILKKLEPGGALRGEYLNLFEAKIRHLFAAINEGKDIDSILKVYLFSLKNPKISNCIDTIKASNVDYFVDKNERVGEETAMYFQFYSSANDETLKENLSLFASTLSIISVCEVVSEEISGSRNRAPYRPQREIDPDDMDVCEFYEAATLSPDFKKAPKNFAYLFKSFNPSFYAAEIEAFVNDPIIVTRSREYYLDSNCTDPMLNDVAFVSANDISTYHLYQGKVFPSCVLDWKKSNVSGKGCRKKAKTNHSYWEVLSTVPTTVYHHEEDGSCTAQSDVIFIYDQEAVETRYTLRNEVQTALSNHGNYCYNPGL